MISVYLLLDFGGESYLGGLEACAFLRPLLLLFWILWIF